MNPPVPLDSPSSRALARLASLLPMLAARALLLGGGDLARRPLRALLHAAAGWWIVYSVGAAVVAVRIYALSDAGGMVCAVAPPSLDGALSFPVEGLTTTVGDVRSDALVARTTRQALGLRGLAVDPEMVLMVLYGLNPSDPIALSRLDHPSPRVQLADVGGRWRALVSELTVGDPPPASPPRTRVTFDAPLGAEETRAMLDDTVSAAIDDPSCGYETGGGLHAFVNALDRADLHALTLGAPGDDDAPPVPPRDVRAGARP